MTGAAERTAVHFPSGEDRCAAWHYAGTNGACVVMAGGFALTKEPATDRFAHRFHAAGFSVLAFDYRRLGESSGAPRLVQPVADLQADWHAALACARALPEVDPQRVAAWAFSASGGHLIPVAAADRQLAAVIAQTPLTSAPAAMPLAGRHTTPAAQLRLIGRGLRDTVRGWRGRSPLLVPLTGPPGTVAMLSTPDALQGPAALEGDRYPSWAQTVAARSVLGLAAYSPGRHAGRVGCPLLVLVCDQDQTAPGRPARRVAGRAPRGELVQLPGGHYAPFTTAHEPAVQAQLEFLRRHLP